MGREHPLREAVALARPNPNPSTLAEANPNPNQVALGEALLVERGALTEEVTLR